MKIHFNNTGYICRATKPNNIKHANFLTFQGYKTANSGDVFLTQRANPEELNELLEQKNFTFENKINSQETKIIKDNIAAMNKPQFTETDFDNLTPKEIQILDNLINKGSELEDLGRANFSIKKDAQRILMGKFPFVRIKENGIQKYQKEDWENYFKFFGITPEFSQNTGKS